MKNRSLNGTLSIYVGVLALLWCTSATAQTAAEIAKKAFASTMLLSIQDGSGQPLALGSGFVVSDGLIATNLHVIRGGAAGYAKLVGQSGRLEIKGTVAIDPERDLALLQVGEHGAPSLSLGDSDAVQVGDAIYAVGNPRGLEGTFSAGIVSGVRNAKGGTLLQITAPISPGSSGGPVLNHQGQVVGVSVATYADGQNLNFAIPSSALVSLIQKRGAVTPIAAIGGRDSKTAAGNDSIGSSPKEGVEGTNFEWTDYSGKYSFTLRNRTKSTIKGVLFLVIFYDAYDNPLDIDEVSYQGLIGPGLAKRLTSRVDSSVQREQSKTRLQKWRLKDEKLKLDQWMTSQLPGRIEFRVLDFDLTQ